MATVALQPVSLAFMGQNAGPPSRQQSPAEAAEAAGRKRRLSRAAWWCEVWLLAFALTHTLVQHSQVFGLPAAWVGPVAGAAGGPGAPAGPAAPGNGGKAAQKQQQNVPMGPPTMAGGVGDDPLAGLPGHRGGGGHMGGRQPGQLIGLSPPGLLLLGADELDDGDGADGGGLDDGENAGAGHGGAGKGGGSGSKSRTGRRLPSSSSSGGHDNSDTGAGNGNNGDAPLLLLTVLLQASGVVWHYATHFSALNSSWQHAAGGGRGGRRPSAGRRGKGQKHGRPPDGTRSGSNSPTNSNDDNNNPNNNNNNSHNNNNISHAAAGAALSESQIQQRKALWAAHAFADAALLGGYAVNVVLLLVDLFRRHSVQRWLLLFLPLLVNALLFMDEALCPPGTLTPAARGITGKDERQGALVREDVSRTLKCVAFQAFASAYYGGCLPLLMHTSSAGYFPLWPSLLLVPCCAVGAAALLGCLILGARRADLALAATRGATRVYGGGGGGGSGGGSGYGGGDVSESDRDAMAALAQYKGGGCWRPLPAHEEASLRALLAEQRRQQREVMGGDDGASSDGSDAEGSDENEEDDVVCGEWSAKGRRVPGTKGGRAAGYPRGAVVQKGGRLFASLTDGNRARPGSAPADRVLALLVGGDGEDGLDAKAVAAVHGGKRADHDGGLPPNGHGDLNGAAASMFGAAAAGGLARGGKRRSMSESSAGSESHKAGGSRGLVTRASVAQARAARAGAMGGALYLRLMAAEGLACALLFATLLADVRAWLGYSWLFAAGFAVFVACAHGRRGCTGARNAAAARAAFHRRPSQ